jgi:hypothetical protein
MLMTDDERAMLEAVATKDRRTAADWLRLAVEDAYRSTFGDRKPKLSPKK